MSFGPACEAGCTVHDTSICSDSPSIQTRSTTTVTRKQPLIDVLPLTTVVGVWDGQD